MSSLTTTLIDAVKSNDFDLVKELLQHGVPINCVDECGFTPLHWSAIYGKSEITYALLNHANCEVDKTDKEKETSQDVDVKNQHNYTAVHLSIKHGNMHVLQLLLNYGANLDAKTQGGRIPEDLAASAGAWDVVQLIQAVRKSRKSKHCVKPKRWELGRLLGCGAFGQVYLGYDLDTGKELAVKCVKTNGQRLIAIKKQVQELDNEIGVLKNLSHKNILRYYGFEKAKPASMYIFMEFMSGGNMHDLVLKLGGLNEDLLRKYTQQILDGVNYLHTNMVIHRDIKGANILLDKHHNHLKLADFGLSKKIERCSMMSDIKSVLGSPYWMAPEVIKSTPCGDGYGRRADIWSIGCTMIEMLTTKPPFNHMEPLPAMYNIGSGRKSPEIPKDVSDSLKDFLCQCFKRDPRCRPSASDLLNHPFLKKDRYPSVPQEIEAKNGLSYKLIHDTRRKSQAIKYSIFASVSMKLRNFVLFLQNLLAKIAQA